MTRHRRLSPLQTMPGARFTAPGARLAGAVIVR